MKLSLQLNCHHRRSSRAGSAMVEMAVCFPVFMLILMGIIEFGRAMSVNQMLNSASRIGCRAAVLDGFSNSSVSSIVKQHVTSTIGCEQSIIAVAITTTSSRTGSTLSDVSLASTGDMIKLDVSVRFADVSWAVKDWMGGSRICGRCSMQHEETANPNRPGDFCSPTTFQPVQSTVEDLDMNTVNCKSIRGHKTTWCTLAMTLLFLLSFRSSASG